MNTKDCVEIPLRKCPQCYFTGRFTSLKDHFSTVHCGKLYFDGITFHEYNSTDPNDLVVCETEFCVWLFNHNIIKCKVFNRSNYSVDAVLCDYVLSQNSVVTIIGYTPPFTGYL